MHRKILVMGLPGAGKTTLATALARRLNAVHFNADEVRRNINSELGFSEADRIEQDSQKIATTLRTYLKYDKTKTKEEQLRKDVNALGD